MVGKLPIGGDHLISVQTMTKTKTDDVVGTLKQIHAAQDAGVDIVRVAVPDHAAAEALPAIIKQTRVPLIADIHYAHGLAIEALENGIDCVRMNPGNVKLDLMQKIVDLAGINAGSIEPRKGLQVNKDMELEMADLMVDTAIEWCERFEKWGFKNFKVSLKSSDPLTTIYTNRRFGKLTDVPLHMGVTEAGTLEASTIKSSVGLGTLLSEGIGDTIRVSITGAPVDEVRVGLDMLAALRLRKKNVDIVACPSCGRDEVEGGVEVLARGVEDAMKGYKGNITVSVLGCIVNGPGEAGQADFGIVGAKDAGYLFKGEKLLRRIPNHLLVSELMKEIGIEEARRKADKSVAALAH
jgi:(E)-4-hydroxy-3-methylbut-2-enyl-diphosphate synthase